MIIVDKNIIIECNIKEEYYEYSSKRLYICKINSITIILLVKNTQILKI